MSMKVKKVLKTQFSENLKNEGFFRYSFFIIKSLTLKIK